VQGAGAGQLLFLFVSALSTSGNFVSGVFLAAAIALGIYRACEMSSWVCTQSEPSLAPAYVEEVAEAVEEMPSPPAMGNEVIVMGKRSASRIKWANN
jgi:hypothetical protein